ncbi:MULTISPECIES: AfsR/SARP family transcriptional regulator [Streptomycetaceae]|uniref:AfsR/SARP family transcriptional regulator n=1 Tax=Streptomycetaceae TaxID=2062 RepID=UPI000B10B2E4|nr:MULTISPECIES: AfsR/SARP family transcriptional regulator [Streptomycetaceae]
MEIKLLGPLLLSHENVHYTMASKRTSVVLTLLATSPGIPVPFDEIVDELWGDQPMANARNALQANVGRLRRLLESVTGRKGDETLRTANGGYLLDVPTDAIDAHRFLRLADAGGDLARRDPDRAIATLEEALGLWRGGALMDSCDGLRCRIRAAHLEERRISAYEDLTAAKLAVDSARVPVSELRQLAVEHSERERLSELLMLALYRDGRQAEALEVFHSTRRRLADDLGLEPGRALHHAYQAILRQADLLGEPRRVLDFAGPVPA